MATPQINSAAKNGCIISLVLVVLLIIDWQLKISLYGNSAMGFLQFVTLTTLLYIFTRRMAISKGDAGMTYGNSLGYIVSMMLFAGVIIGIFQYVMQNYIAVEYYKEIMDYAMLKAGGNTGSPAFEEGMALAQRLQSSIVFVVLWTMFVMMLYGVVIGLVASAFLMRKPNIFADTNRSNGSEV